MKTVVLYTSVTGFTKSYAEWIAQELHADLFALRDVQKSALEQYDIIVYGGSLHAVGIAGLRKLKGMLRCLTEKKLVVYATGACPDKEGLLEELRTKNFGDDSVKMFYLRGGYDHSKLPWFYRIVMSIFISMIRRKKQRNADEEGILQAYEQPVDFRKRENIHDLVEYVKGIGGGF
jgi:menaquinone-dependent protoporphyrinogen IX oxidase